jgi:hypothetical protein
MNGIDKKISKYTENNKDLKGPVWIFLKRIQVEAEGPWEEDRILWNDGEGWPQASQSYLVVPMCKNTRVQCFGA